MMLSIPLLSFGVFGRSKRRKYSMVPCRAGDSGSVRDGVVIDIQGDCMLQSNLEGEEIPYGIQCIAVQIPWPATNGKFDLETNTL